MARRDPGSQAHLAPRERRGGWRQRPVAGPGRGVGAGEWGDPSAPRPAPAPAPLAAATMFVAPDFPFEVSVVIIWLYFRPGSYKPAINKLHFMEHLSFQRIAEAL